jgi:hypothetical protein
MREIIFENHRKDKTSDNYHISVITKSGNIESGWTNGRYLEEVNDDFGQHNKNWFNNRYKAEAYLASKKFKTKM